MIKRILQALILASLFGGSVAWADGTTTLHTNVLKGKTTLTIRNGLGTLSLPETTDTLVGRTTVDTLTNKTINGSNNTITNISLETGVTGALPMANGGVPAGGTTGQVLKKASPSDYDLEWGSDDGGTTEFTSLTMEHTTAPSAPSAGYSKLYMKADGILWRETSGGYEVPVGCQYMGQASIYAASCIWQRGSATLGAFSTDTDCPGPTVELAGKVGTISTSDSDLPRFVLSNIPTPGTVIVQVSGKANGTAASNDLILAVNDGTSTRGEHAHTMSGDSSTEAWGFNLIAPFSYSAAGLVNKTYDIYGATPTGTIQIVAIDENRQLAITFMWCP